MTTDGVADVVRARSFQVVDADGETRGIFSVDEDDRPGIRLLDKQGNLRVSVHLTPDGSPSVDLADTDERVRIGLWVGDDNLPQISLFAEDGKTTLLNLLVDDVASNVEIRRGDASLFLYCAEEEDLSESLILSLGGDIRARLSLTSDDQSGLTLSDSRGNQRWMVCLGEDGSAQVIFVGNDQRMRMAVSESGVTVCDENENVIATLPQPSGIEPVTGGHR